MVHHKHPHARYSQRELREMTQIAHPASGIGFAFDSDVIQPGEFERWFKGLNESQLRALQNRRFTVTVFAYASRAGKAKHNQSLSEQRAQAVVKMLQRVPEFAAQVETHALGERFPPQSNGFPAVSPHPDGHDNHEDRVVYIHIPPDLMAGNVNTAFGAIMKNHAPPKTSQAGRQQVGILFDVLVKPAKDVYDKVTKKPWEVRGPKDLMPRYDPTSMGKDLLERELKWMGVQIRADLNDREILTRIQGSTIQGVLNGLEERAGSHLTLFDRNPFKFSPTYYLAGLNMAHSIWSRLDEAGQANVEAVMRDPAKKRTLMQKLMQAMSIEYAGRDVVLSSREFQTGLDEALKSMRDRGL